MDFKCDLITPECETLRGVLTIDRNQIFFEERNVEPEFIVLPSFFNAHTHLGDSVAKDIEFMPIEKAVRDYKFKVLEEAGDDEIVRCIRNSIKTAFSSGTTAILDFREGGLKGYELLKKADDMKICKPLTRPSNICEAEDLAELSFGFGMSSTRDHDLRFLEDIRDIARKKKVVFAIHAGEVDDSDVPNALSLEPDILIHMNKSDVKNLKIAMEEEIPIVSCIRSNAFFDLLNVRNYRILIDYDLWLIGTDNAMVCNPSMLEEMHFISYLLRSDVEILKAAFRSFKLLGFDPHVLIFHKRKNLFRTRNPISSIVRRACAEDLELVLSYPFFELLKS